MVDFQRIIIANFKLPDVINFNKLITAVNEEKFNWVRSSFNALRKLKKIVLRETPCLIV